MSRSHYLKTRLTAAEHALLKSCAARKGLTVSDYVRTALLSAKSWHRTPQADIAPVATSPVADPAAVATGSVLYPFQRKKSA